MSACCFQNIVMPPGGNRRDSIPPDLRCLPISSFVDNLPPLYCLWALELLLVMQGDETALLAGHV